MSKVRTPTKSAARRKCTHYTIAARLPLVERRVCERQRAPLRGREGGALWPCPCRRRDGRHSRTPSSVASAHTPGHLVP